MQRKQRTTFTYLALAASAAFIIVLFFALAAVGQQGIGCTLLGYCPKQSGGLVFPWSIQNLMWVMFFIALGELGFRRQETQVSHSHLTAGYLPHNEDNSILQLEDLTDIFRKVRNKIDDDAALLPKLIYRAILQFENSRSIDQAASLVNSQMEYLSHQLDLHYTMLRYLIWLIPTLGFIGTVYGISITLAAVGAMNPEDPTLLEVATSNLAVAFDTTLIALVQSAIVVYLMHVIQEKEEHCLNLSGQNCLNNLINRLYIVKGDQQ
ncbi:MAG: MotA/TolQ/ExbB proton channel family protein [Methylobacter sp.]